MFLLPHTEGVCVRFKVMYSCLRIGKKHIAAYFLYEIIGKNACSVSAYTYGYAGIMFGNIRAMRFSVRGFRVALYKKTGYPCDILFSYFQL